MADELPIDDKDQVPKVGELEIHTAAEEGTLPLEPLPFHLLLLSGGFEVNISHGRWHGLLVTDRLLSYGRNTIGNFFQLTIGWRSGPVEPLGSRFGCQRRKQQG